jgi:hypothetical protein
MDMDAFISELLHQHECVIVPGLGGFLTNYSPARIHPLQHVFVPPSKYIVFNAGISHNDGILANYISTVNKISYSESLVYINNWVTRQKSLLKKGNNCSLINIGILSLDHEGNFQFEPFNKVNYFVESYGLSSFVSPPIKRSDVTLEASREKLKPRYRNISTGLKWAAVVLPLMGFAFWGSFHTKDINQAYAGYTNLMPWVNSSSNIRPAVNTINTTGMLFTEYQTIYASVITDRSGMNTVRKIVVSTPVNQPETADQPAKDAAIDIETNSSRYFIIGGAFKLIENAGKYVNQLKDKGYPASIVFKNRRGLYVVGIKGFSDKETAKAQLASIRSVENPAAWLIKR